MTAPALNIAPALSPEDVAAVAGLFRAYADSLPVDLAYQDFGAELAGLPGKYAPPSGLLLLARRDGQPLACVAVRAMGPGFCEIKRLYVAPAGRGLGLGRQLAETAIAFARSAGYRTMRLDTLPDMAMAQTLYRSLGFVPCAPYYPTPVAGTIFLELALTPPAQSAP